MSTPTWIGKDKVVNHHHNVPYRVLGYKSDFEPRIIEIYTKSQT